HRTELAGARAHRTHQHQGGGAPAPALGDVGTFRFRAYRRQLVCPHYVADFLVLGAGRQLHAQPRRLACRIGHAAQRTRTNAVLDRPRALRAGEFAARCRTDLVGWFAHDGSMRRLERTQCTRCNRLVYWPPTTSRNADPAPPAGKTEPLALP